MNRKSILTILVTLIAIHFAAAQEQTLKPKALADLMQLTGKWEGPATFTSDGKTHQFTYFADFKKTADGSGLYMDEWFDAAGLGSLKGSNLIGYNANDKKIHWFSVDNFGTTHDHIGLWKSPNHFFMQAKEMLGKKKFVENIDLYIKDNNSMELLIIATLDGKETEKATANFHRSK